MATTIHVDFPGGKRVDAQLDKFRIQTDQSVDEGGKGEYPDPFQLFQVSIATCAGTYALNFCQERDINTTGLSLSASCNWDKKMKMLTLVTIELKLPAEFPDKYRSAIVRAVSLCTVKKHLGELPEFQVGVS